MADENDKWSAWRSKAPDANKKAQEGFLKGASDNPLTNAYRWLMDDKKKKEQENEG